MATNKSNNTTTISRIYIKIYSQVIRSKTERKIQMSTDEKFRSSDSPDTHGEIVKQRTYSDNILKRRSTDQSGEDKDTPAATNQNDGSEGDAKPDEFEDGIDVSTGIEATAAYNQAAADYDPQEEIHQIAEHYRYTDSEIEEHGFF